MEIVKSLMIYGELCRYHLEIDIEIRMISYWAKFVDMVNYQNFPMLFIIYFSPCLTHIAKTLHDLYFCQTHYGVSVEILPSQRVQKRTKMFRKIPNCSSISCEILSRLFRLPVHKKVRFMVFYATFNNNSVLS
jgi:hypothetical protein